MSDRYDITTRRHRISIEIEETDTTVVLRIDKRDNQGRHVASAATYSAGAEDWEQMADYIRDTVKLDVPTRYRTMEAA